MEPESAIPQPDQTDPTTIEHLPESESHDAPSGASHKHHKLLIIAIAVLLLFAVFAFFLYAAFIRPPDQLKRDAIITPPTPTPFETSQQEILNTATKDWLTYTNHELGISIRHPTTATIDNRGNGVFLRLTPPDTKTVIGICPEWINLGKPQKGENYQRFPPLEPAQLGSHKVFTAQISNGNCLTKIISFSDSTNLQDPTNLIIESQYSSQSTTLIDQILSTFEYTNGNQISITCTDIPDSPELSLSQSYCAGFECETFNDQVSCESADIVKVENNDFISGTDGISDCVWDDTITNYDSIPCQPKY